MIFKSVLNFSFYFSFSCFITLIQFTSAINQPNSFQSQMIINACYISLQSVLSLINTIKCILNYLCSIILSCAMFCFVNLLTLILLYTAHANFNSDPTYVSFSTQNVTGTRIVISPDESVMAVGFADGTFKIVGIMLNEICEGLSTLDSQITDLIWLPTFGPITLDQANTITLWSLDCNITNQLSFNESVRDITGHQIQAGDDNGTTWGMLAINFQNRIQEYDIETGAQIMVYTIPSEEKSLEMIYNADGDSTVLLVSTNASMIRKFEIENGTQIGEFLIESPILQMAKISVFTGDVVIGIAQNQNIIRFDSNGQVLDRGVYPQSVSITICPATKQFALAELSSPSVSLYLYAGQIQQTLTSFLKLPQSIDCSASYLASIDFSGTIQVYTYEEFKSYIIAIIGGVLGGLVILVIAVILIMKYRSKMVKDKQEEQYKSTKRNKYPKEMAKGTRKQPSMQMLKVETFQTSMRD